MSDLISRDEVLSLLPGGQSCDPQAIADAVRSLSTRQQQGADTTDYKALWKAAELHCAQALRERDEALSRAPQPDTVTEALRDDRQKIAKSIRELANDILRDKASDAIDGYNAAVLLEVAETIESFAPLTAALAARGKAG